jgi:RNA polymerase sigma-70 factor (ECF subfamily)
MDGPSDGALLLALERGDATAFAELVQRYQASLLRHARALLGVGGGSGGGFEDVVQEVFLKLLEEPPKLPAEVQGDRERERSHLAAWLHTVTRNGCMDTLRSESRRKRREEQAAVGEAASFERAGGGAAEVEQADTRAAVERSLERLPADQREVLVLRLLGERSYQEIAAITGKRIGTVGWLISEGLKSLAKDLAHWVDAPAWAGKQARQVGGGS